MKKTLIALAAVAVSSAAMAQVTISGAISYGYGSDTAAATGIKTSGYGTDTANVRFSASEDLGGGLKAFGTMGIEGFVEDQPSNGNGVTLGLSGAFGSVVMSSSQSSDLLPVDGLTSAGDGTDADRITYTSPAIAGFTLQVSHQDAIDAGAANGAEMDADARGADSALTASVTFATGPLSVTFINADFRDHATINSRTGGSVSYDFGVAKVSYALVKEDQIIAADITQTGLTIAAPVGPVSVSYSMATSKAVGGNTRDGNSLSVSYPLSKRTSLSLYNESFDAAAGGKTKEQSLLLNHSF